MQGERPVRETEGAEENMCENTEREIARGAEIRARVLKRLRGKEGTAMHWESKRTRK